MSNDRRKIPGVPLNVATADSFDTFLPASPSLSTPVITKNIASVSTLQLFWLIALTTSFWRMSESCNGFAWVPALFAVPGCG